MKDRDTPDEPVIDLGQASVETKGTAFIDSDVGAGQQRYLTGIADE